MFLARGENHQPLIFACEATRKNATASRPFHVKHAHAATDDAAAELALHMALAAALDSFLRARAVRQRAWPPVRPHAPQVQ